MIDQLLKSKLQVIKFSISTDKMSASVSLPKNKPIGIEISSNIIKEYVESHGIKFGLKLANIDLLCARLISGGEELDGMLIAEGERPRDGRDGYNSFAVETDMSAGEVTENDAIDYRERNYVVTVQPDQLIAEAMPPGPASQGMDIFGKKVDGKPGKNAQMLHCNENVRFDDINKRYFSKIEGHVLLNKNRLTITQNLEIDSDISFKTGNVRAVGNVVILGSVKPGFAVQAKGNIKIRGDVEVRSKIIAAGNIEVAGMIKCGKEDGYVKAIGDIFASCVQNSFLKSRGNISILDYVISSDIECGGEFTLTDKRGDGFIRGCNVEAIKGALIRVIGGPDGSSNNLVVGWSQRLHDEYEKCQAEKAELDKQLKECYDALKEKFLPYLKSENELKRLKPHMRNEITKRINELKAKITQFKAEAEEKAKTIAEVEAEMQECDDAKIVILEQAFPQCVLAVKDKKISVLNDKLTPSIISMNNVSGKLEMKRYTPK